MYDSRRVRRLTVPDEGDREGLEIAWACRCRVVTRFRLLNDLEALFDVATSNRCAARDARAVSPLTYLRRPSSPTIAGVAGSFSLSRRHL